MSSRHWLFDCFFFSLSLSSWVSMDFMGWHGMGWDSKDALMSAQSKKMFFLELVALIRHNLPRNNTNNNVTSIKFMHACQTGLSNENWVSNVSHRNVFLVGVVVVWTYWPYHHRDAMFIGRLATCCILINNILID